MEEVARFERAKSATDDIQLQHFIQTHTPSAVSPKDEYQSIFKDTLRSFFPSASSLNLLSYTKSASTPLSSHFLCAAVGSSSLGCQLRLFQFLWFFCDVYVTKRKDFPIHAVTNSRYLIEKSEPAKKKKTNLPLSWPHSFCKHTGLLSVSPHAFF